MFASSFRVGLAILAATTAAYAAEDTVLLISPDCSPSQFGEAPSTLAGDLLDGFDYSCYEVSKKALRWKTKDGFPDGMLDMSTGDFGSDIVTYIKGFMFFIVPLGIFIFFSTIYCTCWSCGMMHCCAKNRKCCGKCCANPPKWTQGTCEYVLFLAIIVAGITCVGLGLKGLTANGDQNKAVEKLTESLDLIGTWTNRSMIETNSLIDTFGSTLGTVDTLVNELESLTYNRDDYQQNAKDAAASIKDGFSGAKTAVNSIYDTMVDLNDQVGNLTDSMGPTSEKYNGYRRKAMLFAWIVLCGLMLWDILVSVLRQMAPNCTEKISCVFGFMTMLYILIMFLLGIVVIVLSILTIGLGDFCQDPDYQFDSVLGMMGGSDDGATTDPAGAVMGMDMFSYYITCDTNKTAINPFNPELNTSVAELWNSAAGFDELEGVFDDALAAMQQGIDTTEAAVAGSCDDATDGCAYYDDYQKIVADEASVETALAAVKDSITKLKAEFVGKNQSTAASSNDVTFPNQGMTEGFFSIMQCYQMNARYHAMINLFCTDAFTSLAQTLELLIASLVLMVIVEWMKRLARPYKEEYDSHGKVHVVAVSPDKWAVTGESAV